MITDIDLDGILSVEKIESFNIPICELEEYESKVAKFYFYRSEILHKYGIDEWSKVIIYPQVCLRIKELKD